jgi:hypothetical protein
MAHLTKPARYDIEDSNIALLGSDVSRCAGTFPSAHTRKSARETGSGAQWRQGTRLGIRGPRARLADMEAS